MIVTINTDASFSHEYKLGAYAFWIVCDQGKILKAGKLKEAVNSTDAETRCIANAVHTLLYSDWAESVSRVVINTDSLQSIKKINYKAPDGSPYRVAYELLMQLRDTSQRDGHKPIHTFKHVKAHSGTDTPRKWVNDWCDKQAKKQLREYIKFNIKHGVKSNRSQVR